MRRTVTSELLDSDKGSSREVADSLADLRLINRLFGGVRTSSQLLRRVAEQIGSSKLSVLDIGSASGDVPLAAGRELERLGFEVNLTLLDAKATHLPMNGTRAAAARNVTTLQTVVGDALALPFADDSFDIATCSLVVHHFEPDQIRMFVSDALRVAKRALIINDVRRSLVHLGLVYAGFPLFRSRITRFDGPASVRRAYTEDELREIVRGLGSRSEFSSHFLYRVGVIIWK